MTKYKDPNSWSYSGIKRRDFRAAHDQPEEMPYRKAGRKNHSDRSRCEHEWGEPYSRQWDSWLKRQTTNDEGHTLYEWSTHGYDSRKCTKCKKDQSQWWNTKHRLWRDSNNEVMSEKHDKVWGYSGRLW